MTTETKNNDTTPVQDDETVYFQGSPALRGALGSMFLSGLLGLGLIAVAVVLSHGSFWIPLAGVLIAVLLVAAPVVITRCVHYRITNYRIDFERGVLSKDIDTLELWHVEDIKFHQSLLDRLLRIGTITVVTHDTTTPILPLRDLPGSRAVFEALKQRIIVVKRQRGVIKLDAG